MFKSLLVAFDFDHTITDDNTDIVARKLLPKNKVPDDVKDLYCPNGWTAYMGKIFELLHNNDIDATQIKTAIINIPPVPGIEMLLTELYSAGSEIIIISDSNSIFIEEWLKAKKLDHVIAEIFTNPAVIDEDDMIKVDMYHTQDWCKLSTVNLCKGHILQNYITKRFNEGVQFTKVAYVGDGKNDLCPIRKLSAMDLAFPRINYALIKLLQNQNSSEALDVKAQIFPWESGMDILKKLKDNFKVV